MTQQPTQAQIEAAAQAIIRCVGAPPPTDKIARYVAEAALTAAFREPKDDYWVYSIDDLNATIERCAQVVERWDGSIDGDTTEEIAAAIRELKDAP